MNHPTHNVEAVCLGGGDGKALSWNQDLTLHFVTGRWLEAHTACGEGYHELAIMLVGEFPTELLGKQPETFLHSLHYARFT
ncbi:MAG: hypothetical protein AAGG44_14770 [Planctomycetota bacterium]